MIAGRSCTPEESKHEHDASEYDHEDGTTLDDHRYVDHLRHAGDTGYAGKEAGQCSRVRYTQNAKRQQQSTTYLHNT